MSTLINKAIFSGAALAAGVGLAKIIEKKLPADSAGNRLNLSMGLTGKTLLIAAGVAAGGAIALTFANKFLKLNILK